MCLAICNDVKLPPVNKQGYCVGYKVIQPDNRSSWYDHIYKKGVNYSNRIYKELDSHERSIQQIKNGIHVFLNLEEARREEKRWMDEKIIKVYFEPEDVVATGTYTYDGDISSNAVVLKVLVKSLNKVRK